MNKSKWFRMSDKSQAFLNSATPEAMTAIKRDMARGELCCVQGVWYGNSDTV